MNYILRTSQHWDKKKWSKVKQETGITAQSFIRAGKPEHSQLPWINNNNNKNNINTSKITTATWQYL